jgi:hypothetical protein
MRNKEEEEEEEEEVCLKIKRIWMLERAAFQSKSVLLLIAVPQIKPCCHCSMRCSPNVKNLKICFGFFSLHSIFFVEDRILKVPSKFTNDRSRSPTVKRRDPDQLPTPLAEFIDCSTCRVCCKTRPM